MMRTTVSPLKAVAAVLSLVLFSMALARAAETPAPLPHVGHALALNPHLRGVTEISPPHHSTLPVARASTLHGSWHDRWDVARWEATHLQYGTVRGVVVDATGAPLAHQVVWLRYASGHPVRHHWEAHVTYTDAAGHFEMRHVIAKEYRLCVRVHKKLEHEQIHVQSGPANFEHFLWQ